MGTLRTSRSFSILRRSTAALWLAGSAWIGVVACGSGPDLATPDYGDAVPVGDDELPVFWACGVTPQAAIALARPAFAITHYPGAMLVTDRRNSDLLPLPAAEIPQ